MRFTALLRTARWQAAPIMGLRGKLFDKKFYDESFPDLPEDQRNPHGYPDMGFGRFADKLPMGAWIKFGSYQRAHLQYLENLPAALVALLIGGLSYPRVQLALAVAFIIGRQLYAMGYRRGGDGRNTHSPRHCPLCAVFIVIVCLRCPCLSAARVVCDVSLAAGGQGRLPGAGMAGIAWFGMAVVAVYGMFMAGGGVAGLTALFKF
jgi:hypothetical protein